MIMRSLILLLFAIVSIHALENPIPSMLLQPRNFNPHPYQEEAKRFLIAVSDHDDLGLEQKLYQLAQQFRNTGPVRFPENPELYVKQEQNQEQHRSVVSHIINRQALQSPQYQKISQNRRPKKMRVVTTDQYEVPRILAALTNHARRVQNNEFQHPTYSPTIPQQPTVPQQYLNRIDNERPREEVEDRHVPATSNLDKKHYKFAYSVKDRHSGDDFSHIQKQENGAVKGSYKVRLPDGRLQITKYVADDTGYHADVTYEEDTQPEVSSQPVKTYHEPSAIDQNVYYPQNIKENKNIRYTVTPTPYHSEYNHIRAPTIRKSYPSTTSIPNSYY